MFSHLPVHAAGSYGKHNEQELAVSDFCVVSYTPTLGALLLARARSGAHQIAAIKVLLAAAAKPFKMAPLPHAGQEVAHLRSIIPAEALLNASADSGDPICSSADQVLRHIKHASILHLACHGFQRPGVPLESGFVMRDAMLTVSDLMRFNLTNAFLAFLSACESARSDEQQPNQAITLASTMLFAGFNSVVGTMWSVHLQAIAQKSSFIDGRNTIRSMGDVDGPVVAGRVYEALFRGKSELLDPDAVPYALDEVTQAMRSHGLHATRWATYVHMGI